MKQKQKKVYDQWTKQNSKPYGNKNGKFFNGCSYTSYIHYDWCFNS